MTILVAEDYQSNYDLIEAMLGKMYKLVHAHDGMEAIIFYEQYRPDLILMDIKCLTSMVWTPPKPSGKCLPAYLSSL